MVAMNYNLIMIRRNANSTTKIYFYFRQLFINVNIFSTKKSILETSKLISVIFLKDLVRYIFRFIITKTKIEKI